MKVCLLGGSGQLGPWVVKELERCSDYSLRITDVKPPDSSPHETMTVDVSDLDQVRRAAEGCDVIVNCAVLRPHRQVAWDVNTMGTYNAMRVAVDMGHERLINTGPHFTIAGPTYEWFDYSINPDIPPQSGTGLYALTKSLGQEICRVFTENHDVHVLTLLFYNFREADDHSADGQDFTPFSVTWGDAGEAFRHALRIDLERLPSRCEIFNIFADLPHDRFSNEKAKRILGWQPTNQLEQFWRKSKPG